MMTVGNCTAMILPKCRQIIVHIPKNRRSLIEAQFRLNQLVSQPSYIRLL